MSREYVCIPVAQVFHWYEIKLKMMTMDLGVGGKKITKVPKLNEAKAIEQVPVPV
jgi:Optic atrophy 3 protein (OPA3)